MLARAKAAWLAWVDGVRADREESWDHAPDHRRDNESIASWLRKTNRVLGARHWRKIGR